MVVWGSLYFSVLTIASHPQFLLSVIRMNVNVYLPISQYVFLHPQVCLYSCNVSINIKYDIKIDCLIPAALSGHGGNGGFAL